MEKRFKNFFDDDNDIIDVDICNNKSNIEKKNKKRPRVLLSPLSPQSLPSTKKSKNGKTKTIIKNKINDQYEYMLSFDNDHVLSNNLINSSYIIGVDEVRRGVLLGSVVVCACAFPNESSFAGLRDSKKISEKDRQVYSKKMMEDPNVLYCIVEKTREQIDKDGINSAILEAMSEAVLSIVSRLKNIFNKQKNQDHNNNNNQITTTSTSTFKTLVLVDGNQIPHGLINQNDIIATNVIKGDDTSLRIAAASIIAKVQGDNLAVVYHKMYPVYNLDANKGYGTKDHINMIKKHGYCDLHRQSFDPIKSIIRKEQMWMED